ncbi:MAG: DUF4845 domain-containing protein [Betaproteobacteria bacterium]|nr:DUF4845 domain-containing protein [Betaproteobacteria bacterium]
MTYGALRKQEGISISGLMFWVVILVLIAILGMKVAPAYIENSAIEKVFNAIVNDDSLQNATASQLRQSFIKRAQIDRIEVVTAKDIVINKEKGKTQLSVNYTVLIPLFSNISLHIDFEPKSD